MLTKTKLDRLIIQLYKRKRSIPPFKRQTSTSVMVYLGDISLLNISITLFNKSVYFLSQLTLVIIIVNYNNIFNELQQL